MVHDAADAGAWGIKTQLLRPETIAIPDAPKYWTDDHGTTNQRDAFRAAGLVDYDAWGPVRAVAASRGIAFVATPFDMDAIDALEKIDVDAYKVASGDLMWWDLIDRLVDTQRPLIISTGAAWQDEIESTVSHMIARDPSVRYRLILLACSLVYPTPDGDANVGRVVRLREVIAENGWSPIRVGYSDHTTSVATPRDAAAAGSVIVEKHYTFRGASGPVADHAMAVDPDGLRECVRAANVGARAYGDASLIPSDDEDAARRGARRGLYLTRPVVAGDLVHVDDVVALRPCPRGAVSPHMWRRLVAHGAQWRSSKMAGDVVWSVDLD
jgi:sialic acid synthase SpsE